MTESLISNKGVVALLPFATPHKGYKKGGVFHPAMMPMKAFAGKSSELDETKDYFAYSAVKVASTISHTVIATIPPKTTIGGMAVDQLISSFVNPQNILAEVERIEHHEESVASQVKVAFEAVPSASSVLVVWPYQVFDAEQPLAAPGSAEFTFTHQMANFKRSDIPECVCISVTDESKDSLEQVECKDVALHSELDTIIKGAYTRVLSMVEIKREDFEEFAAGPDYPNLVLLLKKTLAGKRGILVNPKGHTFI